MPDKYLYESFSSESAEFDQKFSNYLNKKWADNWKVKTCNFCHGTDEQYASCLFKRKS